MGDLEQAEASTAAHLSAMTALFGPLELKRYIIAGFPGIGKSYASKIIGYDSDSTDFSWADEAKKDRHPEWPQNYMNHIKDFLSGQGLSFLYISTHAEVLQALNSAGIGYMLVVPDVSEKERYLAQYRKRGSPEAFVNLMDSKWEEFLGSCKFNASQASQPVYVLPVGKHLCEIGDNDA